MEVDSILSYCHYSLNDTALTRELPYLEAKRLGIVSASPLSMGLLTLRGENIARLALQFSLANPRIHTTLAGSASPDNMIESVRWMEEPIDMQLLAEVRELLALIHNKTW